MLMKINQEKLITFAWCLVMLQQKLHGKILVSYLNLKIINVSFGDSTNIHFCCALSDCFLPKMGDTLVVKKVSK